MAFSRAELVVLSEEGGEQEVRRRILEASDLVPSSDI